MLGVGRAPNWWCGGVAVKVTITHTNNTHAKDVHEALHGMRLHVAASLNNNELVDELNARLLSAVGVPAMYSDLAVRCETIEAMVASALVRSTVSDPLAAPACTPLWRALLWRSSMLFAHQRPVSPAPAWPYRSSVLRRRHAPQ